MWTVVMMGLVMTWTLGISALIVVWMTRSLTEAVSIAFQRVLSPGDNSQEQPTLAQVLATVTAEPVMDEESLPWERWEPQVLNPNTEFPTEE